jgi:hypothetical protein
MKQFEKYLEEIKEDTRFDQINILEKQLSLPAIKHKWVSYLIKNKIRKNELEKNKKELKENILKKYTDEKIIPTGIPKTALNAKIESSKIIKEIDDEIKELDIIIEYLEKVEKIFSSLTYDLGNATKLMVLETT